jgi:hypothetical protein
VCLDVGVGVCEGGTGLGVWFIIGGGVCFGHASGALELCVWMWV